MRPGEGRCFAARAGIDFAKDRRDVMVDGLGRDEQPLADLLVGPALVDRAQHVKLAGGKAETVSTGRGAGTARATAQTARAKARTDPCSGSRCTEAGKDREAGGGLPNCTDPRLQRALIITINNIGARLPEVCREAGMSERTLRRRLKAETGMTWEAYRQRSRLLRAVALFDDPNVSVTRVSAACGFDSPSAFAKAFRLALGETPSAYRRRIS